MQAMAQAFGGEVSNTGQSEFGHAQLRISDLASDSLFAPLTAKSNSDSVTRPETVTSETVTHNVWMSHGDRVESLPSGFVCLASSDNAPIAAMADNERQFYGLQFHPEVTHTENGIEILRQFVVGKCGAATEWTPDNIIEESVVAIRQQVGNEEVILALSGGVDSSVVALLLHRAIGDQLTLSLIHI